MAVGFVRRYLSDPGTAELIAIEGVVIIDREPPASISGVGSGTALLLAEFENGPFETPSEVFSGTDLLTRFGGFGFTYNGVIANNPAARGRKADAAIAFEYWNGNGFIALTNKKFRRLIVNRIDTTVGEVSFTRLACITGGTGFTFDIEPAQTLIIDVGAGNVTVTFNAAAALINSAAGTYPSTFAGGETLTFKIDGTSYTATFLASDQTQTQVISRLNAAAGYTAFTNQGGGITRITGIQRGSGGSVQIVSVSAALVTTATGFTPAAAVAGTGNVANIDAVSVSEVHTVVSGTVGLSGTVTDRDASNHIRMCNTGTPGTGTIKIAATSTALGFGFAVLDTVYTAATGTAGTIPAGTQVRNGSAVEWVTAQDVTVTAASAGPYTAKVRPANDDGTTGTSLVSTLTVMPTPIALGGFAVTNNLPIAAALTEAAIDAKYIAAMDKTKDVSTVVREANFIWSARMSNAVRGALKQNALDASANGCFGRMTAIRPPLGSSRATAKSTTAQPGVGAYRDQRVIYNYPGISTNVAQIATRGTAGGAGFTVDGAINTGADSWAVSVMTQLAPEENPGQGTTFMSAAIGLETGNTDIVGMTIDDYKSFRASGIMAPRFDNGDAFFQSGITSVDPLVSPNLRNIARRRMADFIQDTLSLRLVSFNKKLATKQRRALILSEIDSFMSGLLSPDNPSLQRIGGYNIDGKSGNTAATLALGIYRIILKVLTLSSLDSIVLDTEVGESVVLSEAA